jgi:hypothetical protein
VFFCLFDQMWRFGLSFMELPLFFDPGRRYVAYFLITARPYFEVIAFGALANSVTQHPLLGLLGIAAVVDLFASVFYYSMAGNLLDEFSYIIEALQFPSCPPDSTTSYCYPESVFYVPVDSNCQPCIERDQHLRFFVALCIAVCCVVIVVLHAFNVIMYFRSRASASVTPKERWSVEYTHDLYRQIGMHTSVRPDLHRADDDDGDADTFDDLLAPQDDGDVLSRDVPRIQRRLPPVADRLATNPSFVGSLAYMWFVIRVSPLICWATLTSTAHKLWSDVWALFQWNDARIRYPLRLVVTIWLSVFMTVFVIWMLVNQLFRASDALVFLKADIDGFSSGGGRVVFGSNSTMHSVIERCGNHCIGNAIETFRIALLVCGGLSAAVVFLLLLYGWLGMLRSHRTLIFKFRRGIFPYKEPTLMGVTLFTGITAIVQCSTIFVAALGAIGLAVLSTLAVVFPDFAVHKAAAFAIAYTGIYGSRWLLSFCLLQARKSTINNYVCWTLLDVVNLVLGVTVGPYSAFVRFVLQIVFTCFSFSRVDVTIMPPGFEQFDRPFKSFYAIVVLDHRVNNPIAQAFIFLALTGPVRFGPPLRGSDASLHVSEQQRSLVDNNDDDNEEKPRSRAESEFGLSDVAFLPLQRRHKAARNRWWLYFILMRNPSIRKYRKLKI